MKERTYRKSGYQQSDLSVWLRNESDESEYTATSLMTSPNGALASI